MHDKRNGRFGEKGSDNNNVRPELVGVDEKTMDGRVKKQLPRPKGNFMFFISRSGNACVIRSFLFAFISLAFWPLSPDLLLTVIVNPFPLHRVHVRIVGVLDAEDAVYTVAAADSTLGSVQ